MFSVGCSFDQPESPVCSGGYGCWLPPVSPGAVSPSVSSSEGEADGEEESLVELGEGFTGGLLPSSSLSPFMAKATPPTMASTASTAISHIRPRPDPPGRPPPS